MLHSERSRWQTGARSTIGEGWVAQLVEQRTENPRVGGSIPPPATVENCLSFDDAIILGRSLVGRALSNSIKQSDKLAGCAHLSENVA
jgi:hypothetical protein